MQYVAAGLWWVVVRLFGWLFSATGVASFTRWVAGLLRPFVGPGATWASRLLVGGAVVGGAQYSGLLPRIFEEARLLLIDLVVWFIDQMLALGLAALAVLDAYVPPVSSTFGLLPAWVVQIGTASGFFLYVSICLSAAVAIKLVRMIPGVRI